MKTDDIEILLKQHFQQQHEYLDDNGFTANLMSMIPQKRNLNPWIKWGIFWLPVLVASLFALNQLPLLDIIHSVIAFFLRVNAQEFILISGVFFAMIIAYVGFTFVSETES